MLPTKIIKLDCGFYDDDVELPRSILLTTTSFEESYANLRDKDKTVIPVTSVTLVIDYPVRAEVTQDITADSPSGFMLGELVCHIATMYQRIYDEEDASTVIPAVTSAEYYPGSNLMNRVETDGIHGIWGHVLSDLAMHTLHWCESTGKVYIDVDS